MCSRVSHWRAAVRRHASWTAVKAYFKSFKRDQWQVAFQIWAAFVLIGGVTAITTVYDALSYRLIAPPLALLFTVWMYSSPFSAGEVNFKIVSLIPAAFIGGLIAFGIQRAMYAANDYNWDDDSVTKAAVLIGMATPIAAGFNVLRWMSEATNVFFFYVNIFIALSINLGAYYAPNIKYLHQWYILANAAIGIGVCALCANFLFPVTAGYRYRKCIGSSLRSFADAVESMIAVLLEDVDPETGRLDSANDVCNPATGYDEGMEKRVSEIMNHLVKSRNAISASRSLHFPVLFEVDVYNRPWRFPRHQFMQAKIFMSAALSMMTMMIRPLESGKINLALFRNPAVKKRIDRLGEGMQKMLRLSGDAVERSGDWVSVDAYLEQMDDDWRATVELISDSVVESSESEAVIGMFLVAEYLYLFGIRLREVYSSLAAAVNPTDLTAIPLSKKRFAQTPEWAHPSSGLGFATEVGDGSGAQGVEKNALSSGSNDEEEEHSEVPPDSSQTPVSMKKRIKHDDIMLKLMYGHKSNKILRSRRAYGMPISVVFGIQYGIAVGIALILASIPAVAEYAFIDRPFDVVITVIVVWVPNIGTTTTRGVQRVIGTLLTAAVSYLIITFSYLAAGASWNNNSGKFVVGWAISSVYAGFCVLNAMRDPAREYLWSVANFTLATTTLPVFRADSPWRRLGQRSANMIIGGLIVWAVAIFVMPISTRWMTQVNFATCFKYLGSLLGGFRDDVTSKDDEDNKVDSGKTGLSLDNSLLATLNSDVGKVNDTLSLLITSEDFETAFKVQLAVGDIKSYIGALEDEFLLFKRPHRIPKGVTDPAANALQEMLDIVKMLHFVRLEEEPVHQWVLPCSHYELMIQFTSNVIDTLNLLSQAVLKPGTHMDSIIEKLTHVQDIVLDHMHHEMASLHCRSSAESIKISTNNSTASSLDTDGPGEECQNYSNKTNGNDRQHGCLALFGYMRNSLALLIYLELCCYQQLRSLISTVFNAVLIKDEALRTEANAKLSAVYKKSNSIIEATCGMEIDYLLADLQKVE